ncbi:hypothetical protein NDU88_005093 [Pleurodeles waltl]|uniref:Myb/SANT-like DNA-binding domain-containing protein n=1 Tax=Pleurodeles waltl TaxID=8319 RepID=A0AAV7RJZ2_PLEWA|nr:hypothetical protein NDU88_005093 [Pleurodeles waltl]
MPPSPHMSQRTVPMKDNSEHRVKQLRVSAHQKKDIWRAIAKDVRTLGVYHRQSTHCRKRWEDICRWSKKPAEAQLGMASQRGRGARRTMTPRYPADVQDAGGGLPGVGWALEGITAATRG